MLSKRNMDRLPVILVFLIAFTVYFFSAERTGSLWDCGEFILGAYKMQVVHPPGAPLFLLMARLFALAGDITSSDPSNIAFFVNLMSALFSAMTAALVASMAMKISKGLMAESDADTDTLVVPLAGIVAGLATAFTSSIWFSAVEGEVYALSTFFTALTLWAMVKWYYLPNEPKSDRWIVFAAYSAGLSIGVHLLSLLTFPALAMLIYFKKSKNFSWGKLIGSIVLGALCIPVIQKLIITGIPGLWQFLDIMMVNGFGLPFMSGLVPTLLIVAAVFYFGFKYAIRKRSHILELLVMSALMVVIGYSTIGAVVIRANADTPVNMNVPSDPTRLLQYLNREQYGERDLLYGPSYEARPIDYDRKKRYGRVDFPPYYNSTTNQDYVYVDEKISPQYATKDKMLFPRISDRNMGRPKMYQEWYKSMMSGEPDDSFMFNLGFFLKYQIGWMYIRYFSWNFIGKQNATQGFFSWDKSSGNWESGIKLLDEAKLYNMDQLPMTMKDDKGRNHYYFLPFIFGLLGLVFHALRDQKTFFAILTMFLITGVGIIIYTNQPPNEPRERDYVLVGSFFTFCIWIGLAVPALVHFMKQKIKLNGNLLAIISGVIVLMAPLLMGTQNFDDHSRREHFASRDYAKNFLYSLEPNAIIFTYGDNDTYPLWYVQEVEDVRRDVRIVNLSLIAVDWYINKLRQKVNDSEPIKLTIPASAMRGDLRNQMFFYNGGQSDRTMDIRAVLRFMGEDHPIGNGVNQMASFIPTRKMVIPVDRQAVQRMGMFAPGDSVNIVNAIPLTFAENKQYITKDDIAVMDVIASNINERPIYFATTCKNDKLLGLNDYMQYEGLALRIIPVRNPSDKGMSIYGSGRVEVNKTFDNIMNKFVWGNFEKENLFVDHSYGAGVQAHRMVMIRTAEELLEAGEKEKASAMASKYFEAFPHMNFPYDSGTIAFISVLVKANAIEEAKKHLRILANETADYLQFYESIDPDVLKTSFGQDFGLRMRSVSSILSFAQIIGEEEFTNEMNDLLAAYDTRKIKD